MRPTFLSLFGLTFLFAAYHQPSLSQDAEVVRAVQHIDTTPPLITKVQMNSVLLAIQDEVYDYENQKKFYRVGITRGTGTQVVTTIPVYIRPMLDKDGGGEMIYKDMPYGEILRVFHLRSDGLAVLDNDPEVGFPLTEPSHLTLFMDDDEVIRDKQTWVRIAVDIADMPPQSRIAAAAKRQTSRVGFSAYLTKHASSN